jgi:hypothetical protein
MPYISAVMLLFRMNDLTYTGVSKKDALDILTTHIRRDLSEAGLRQYIYYRAEDIVSAGGKSRVTRTLKIPPGASPEIEAKVHEIIRRHEDELIKERHGHL